MRPPPCLAAPPRWPLAHGRRARRRHLATAAGAPDSSPPSPSPPPSALQASMRARPAKAVYDVLSPTPSHLLNIALSDHIPRSCAPPGAGSLALPGAGASAAPALPQGHHLVYFPPQVRPSRLLPDGTDPDHAPGPPFARRLWAGGAVRFAPGWRRALRLDGRRAACVESIGDVAVRGAPGAERAYVDVWRRYGPVAAGAGDERAALDGVSAAPAIEERRTLVFLRDKTPAEARDDAARAARVLKPPYEPDFAFALTPTPALLFHFSALTFNAHAIHLDPLYARAVEGHRAPLVHGPLGLVLMLAALRSRLGGGGAAGGAADGAAAAEAGGPAAEEGVERIEYRNLAPLYAGEPMRVCVRRREGRDAAAAAARTRWDVWIEGPEGGLAVRGSATTAVSD